MQVYQDRTIILASASPRRHELLGAMGLSFQVVTADIDETPHPQESPLTLAHRLSNAKAKVIAAAYIDALIIAADTLVVLDGEILGKPRDEADARQMLTRLRNRQHLVYSGLTVIDPSHSRSCTQLAMTPVRMRDYSDEEILRYVASGDPMDKAGAYGIQSPDWNPVACFEGCYANVMGFPMCHLYRILRAWKVEVPLHPLRSCPLAVTEGCLWADEVLRPGPVPCVTGTGPSLQEEPSTLQKPARDTDATCPSLPRNRRKFDTAQ